MGALLKMLHKEAKMAASRLGVEAPELLFFVGLLLANSFAIFLRIIPLYKKIINILSTDTLLHKSSCCISVPGGEGRICSRQNGGQPSPRCMRYFIFYL